MCHTPHRPVRSVATVVTSYNISVKSKQKILNFKREVCIARDCNNK